MGQSVTHTGPEEQSICWFRFCLRHILHSCFLWDWFVPLLLADAKSKDSLAQIRVSPGAGAVVIGRNTKSQHSFWTKIRPSKEAFLKESILWNKGVGYSSQISPCSLKTHLGFRLTRLRNLEPFELLQLTFFSLLSLSHALFANPYWFFWMSHFL